MLHSEYNEGDVSRIPRCSKGDRTRNNEFKCERFRFRKEIGMNWLSHEVAGEWNRLTQVVGAETVRSFNSFPAICHIL